MDKFTASNGMNVERDESGDVVINKGEAVSSWFMKDGTALALDEFFRAEEDERLGRWRWPENPSIVAWASRRSNEKDVTVLDESAGYVGYFARADVKEAWPGEGAIRRAAHAYFDAHPEPKPWLDAKPGEVWVIDEANHEATAARAGLVNERVKFEPVNNITRHIDVDDTSILNARRIWPEEEA